MGFADSAVAGGLTWPVELKSSLRKPWRHKLAPRSHGQRDRGFCLVAKSPKWVFPLALCAVGASGSHGGFRPCAFDQRAFSRGLNRRIRNPRHLYARLVWGRAIGAPHRPPNDGWGASRRDPFGALGGAREFVRAPPFNCVLWPRCHTRTFCPFGRPGDVNSPSSSG
jgi:hypothetical protein